MTLRSEIYDPLRDLAFVGLPALVAAPGEEKTAPPPVRDAGRVTFPRSYWDSDKRSYLLLIEFLADPAWRRIQSDLPPVPSRDVTLREIDRLRALMPEREVRQAEIMAQAEGIYVYYFARLMMSEKSHPRTFELMNAAIVVGRALAISLKEHFGRVRPSQLAPDLEPMLAVPGHPSYPGGHSLQARLMARMLGALRPDAQTTLLELASRIGVNREIAGLHYASDTAVGEKAGDAAFRVLSEGRLFNQLLDEARAEWV